MRYFSFCLLLFLLAGCKLSTSDNPQSANRPTFDISAAKKAIAMARSLAEGDSISAPQWDSLFATPPYRAYLCSGNETQKRKILRENFEIAFDPKYQEVLDSLLQSPVTLGPNTQQQLLLRNLKSLKEKFLLSQMS